MYIIELIKRRIANGTQHPELHTCPHCGAPLTRLTLIQGGIIKFGSDSRVKATIGCRDCKRNHIYRGTGIKDHWLVMTLANNSRIKKGYC